MKVAISSIVVVVLSIGIFMLDAKAAGTPDAKTLLRKSVQAMHTKNEEAIYVMKLIGSGGDVSTRRMRVWFKSASDDDAKLMLKFTEPADIRGTGFLTIVEKGKPSDQWLYLPALKKSRRIKGGNADEPFLGSDFTMGDLSVEKEDGMEYKITGTQKCDESQCHILTGTPSAGYSGSYSKKIMYIRTDSFMNVKSEIFNQAGQLEKVQTLLGVHKEGSSRWIADKVEMKNVLTNHSTVLEFEKRDASRVPGDHVFTVSFLERQ